jgi:hypothetical protein
MAIRNLLLKSKQLSYELLNLAVDDLPITRLIYSSSASPDTSVLRIDFP